MKIILFDVDTLRADHLGCYGYDRKTSANIDSVAKDGTVFDSYFCSDAPCLPSRAALMTGRFGIHTGIINHGGTTADMRHEGPKRDFVDHNGVCNLPAIFRIYGFYTGTVSTFAERHSAWWFNAGFNEVINTGKCGQETADQVAPLALEWMKRNQKRDYFLHINFWDPHTPYRTPLSEGEPFKGQPSAALKWIDQDTLNKHLDEIGFHCAHEINGYSDAPDPEGNFPRAVNKIENLNDVRKDIDGYDTGIYYADKWIGKIIDYLKESGDYDDTAIIVTADHGEDLGELGRYSEHGTADYPVTRLPFIIKWPHLQGGRHLKSKHYNLDLLPSVLDLLPIDKLKLPHEEYFKAAYGENYKQTYTSFLKKQYDGKSFGDDLIQNNDVGYDSLVVSLATHAVQRSVYFGDYLYIKTYHDGYCLFPDEMVFDISKDPHETNDLSKEHPELLEKGGYLLGKWVDEQMNKSDSQVDPLWTCIREGGGYHANGKLDAYEKRLDQTGRSDKADLLRKKYPKKPF
jgi:choline-sulfatase